VISERLDDDICFCICYYRWGRYYWILDFIISQKKTLDKQKAAVTNRGLIEMRLHVTAELVAAVLLLIAGVSLLLKASWGQEIFLIAIGMLLYTCINSAGYFAQIRQFSMILIFMAVFILSLISLALVL
jgi:hypothetical protein